jgi:hypothetical protein
MYNRVLLGLGDEAVIRMWVGGTHRTMRSYPPSVSSLRGSSGIVVVSRYTGAVRAFQTSAVLALDRAFAAMSPFSTQEHIL